MKNNNDDRLLDQKRRFDAERKARAIAAKKAAQAAMLRKMGGQK